MPGSFPCLYLMRIAADGDISGDAAIAWLQGPANATQVVVGELYQPPGRLSANQPVAVGQTRSTSSRRA